MKTRELTLTAMFTALLAVGAYLSLPIGLVSVTMQTLFVMLAGLILPRRNALLAVGAYLLLGLAGLPVFAGGIGGPAILSRASLGFLLGFFPLAWISGSPAANSSKRRITALLLGNLALYVCGFCYMYLYFNVLTAKPMQAAALLQAGVLPYLPGDAIKLGLAEVLFRLWGKKRQEGWHRKKESLSPADSVKKP